MLFFLAYQCFVKTTSSENSSITKDLVIYSTRSSLARILDDFTTSLGSHTHVSETRLHCAPAAGQHMQ